MGEHVESLLSDLLEAMIDQTEAINSLAASNMALVDAMAADVENEDDAGLSRTYLDGSPR